MKKIISMVLCLAMLSAMVVTALADSYSSEYKPSNWAESDIYTAETAGLIPNSFYYKWAEKINREQFCEIAYNMLDKVGKMQMFKGGFGGNTLPFTDTKSETVLVLNSIGIINGKSNNTFAPNDFITREEAAVILDRMVKYIEIETGAKTYIAFSDDKNISDWARDAVYNMNTLGIMKGTDKGFEPQSNYTNEQSVATIVRLYNLFIKQKAVLKLIDKDNNIVISDFDVSDCTVKKSDQAEVYVIEIALLEQGRKKIADATEKIAEYDSENNYISILVNNEVVSKPRVQSKIDNDSVIISGDFSYDTATQLAALINSGNPDD